ncbi:T9SS type A sorting domain-containing protein [Flavobacterium sp. xlx-214]|uniref:zinc-dependent metalloprotease n=1 Tax=unclassified Flavobacterium TaxID=196869 RepID=UPI0013D2A81E|nr:MULTISPECIES: zinc-dependent metalloprotease [unclassified Flavobacterium]MBA5793616.1 T9SS type A sorting domain-containing protein [Flavobacterium sp. xlx-221]QMI84545.1 T9SS type A sorting domain-containing protein [Flavobacterium sp. xlx-214]
MKILKNFIWIYSLLLSAVLLAQNSASASVYNPFKATTIDQINNNDKFVRAHQPEKFQLYTLNVATLLQFVQKAPKLSNTPSNVTMKLPDAKGVFHTFWIYDNSAMEEELASTVSNIRSLKAIDIENPAHNISISISTIFGFHAMGMMTDGTVYYMDNYTNDLNTVIVYDRSSLEAPKSSFSCLLPGDSFDEAETNTVPIQTFSMDNKRRTYRLALACTIEYAQFHINRAPAGTPNTTLDQKKEIVLAAMNVTLTRLNQIFEREMNVHLSLIANNKSIIFVTSDNFNNDDAGVLIDQSQTVIDNIIGTSNYDIGHTFSTGGGGLASLGSVCSTWSKASGITGSSFPVGDAYDVDYVAHEMGHQFGANHTFNNSCQFNRNSSTAMEVGSGSTIMSYAGICPSNVQNNVDAYYHYVSIKEIQAFLAKATCAQQTTVTNSAPIVTNLQSKTIPYGTPFILNALATDADGDQLTYTFEQINTQITTQPPVATATTGPAFRSMQPTTNNYRSFPAEDIVLDGSSNPDGIVGSKWERLASVGRSYSFVATVRDNNALGARVVYTQPVTITAANTGPFLITYPDNNPSTKEPIWNTGTTKNITWNVAGTTANNINTANVNILVSIDNGLTYTMLAANVPNNGSTTVTIPTTIPNTYEGRIKIEAVGNIFYTVSKKLIIWDPTASVDDLKVNHFKMYPNPAKDILNVSFSTEENNTTQFDVFDLNGRLILTHTLEKATDVNTQISIDQLATGTYILKITNGSNSSSHKFIKQ